MTLPAADLLRLLLLLLLRLLLLLLLLLLTRGLLVLSLLLLRLLLLVLFVVSLAESGKPYIQTEHLRKVLVERLSLQEALPRRKAAVHAMVLACLRQAGWSA